MWDHSFPPSCSLSIVMNSQSLHHLYSDGEMCCDRRPTGSLMRMHTPHSQAASLAITASVSLSSWAHPPQVLLLQGSRSRKRSWHLQVYTSGVATPVGQYARHEALALIGNASPATLVVCCCTGHAATKVQTCLLLTTIHALRCCDQQHCFRGYIGYSTAPMPP